MVGYSLVGVYPCALWKPQTCGGCSTGAVRPSRLASSVRASPYPSQAEPCRCRASVAPSATLLEETPCDSAATAASGTTPMLFVPYNYAPHLALAASNSVSPSGNTTPLIKVRLESIVQGTLSTVRIVLVLIYLFL